jgi:hypothetical protein
MSARKPIFPLRDAAREVLRKPAHYRYRSAKDGRFVTARYALLHPSTTVRESA